MKVLPFLLIIHISVLAQQDPSSSIPLSGIIDAENAELDEAIARCAYTDEPCGWYNNEIIINAGNEPWRAVGNYQKRVKFWYNDDPQFADVEDDRAERTWVLRKVEISTLSTYIENITLYFVEGQLTCWKYYGENMADDLIDEVVYFHKGRMIEDGTASVEIDEYEETIQNWAIFYQDLFLKCF